MIMNGKELVCESNVIEAEEHTHQENDSLTKFKDLLKFIVMAIFLSFLSMYLFEFWLAPGYTYLNAHSCPQGSYPVAAAIPTIMTPHSG
jgi:hypothetical protein